MGYSPMQPSPAQNKSPVNVHDLFRDGTGLTFLSRHRGQYGTNENFRRLFLLYIAFSLVFGSIFYLDRLKIANKIYFVQKRHFLAPKFSFFGRYFFEIFLSRSRILVPGRDVSCPGDETGRDRQNGPVSPPWS